MKNFLIWYCCILHLVWGTLILIDPSTINITAIHSISRLITNPILLGSSCILCAILAIIGMTKKFHKTFWGLTLMLPQQLILMESLIGAIIAISHSTFADGVVRPRAFIACDQAPAILAAILHTIAIIEIHLHEVIVYWERKIIKCKNI